MKRISPQDASRLAGSGGHLLDVRTPGEFRTIHATGASLLPMDRIQSGATPDLDGDERALLVLCKSGKRAEMAARSLSKVLKNPIHVVEGGTDAWVADGLPHEKGEGVMSLERQVRIAAGSLVLGGVLLSTFVSPVASWVSGFVGAGLIFAGITDTCGMGMLAKMLAKMRLRVCLARLTSALCGRRLVGDHSTYRNRSDW